MKYQVRKAAGKYWLVDLDQEPWNFQKPVVMNETGYEIWQMFSNGLGIGEISEEIAANYSISIDEAKSDVKAFFDMLSDKNIKAPKEKE